MLSNLFTDVLLCVYLINLLCAWRSKLWDFVSILTLGGLHLTRPTGAARSGVTCGATSRRQMALDGVRCRQFAYRADKPTLIEPNQWHISDKISQFNKFDSFVRHNMNRFYLLNIMNKYSVVSNKKTINFYNWDYTKS